MDDTSNDQPNHLEQSVEDQEDEEEGHHAVNSFIEGIPIHQHTKSTKEKETLHVGIDT